MSRIESIRWSLARCVGAVALLVAIASLAPFLVAVDLPLQRAAQSLDTPGVVRDYFNATEAFGNGFGVAMIVLAVVVLDRTRRVQTGRLLIASLGAGLLADTIKLSVARLRPHSAGLDGLLAEGASGAETFVAAMPLTAGGSAMQSFPSAHTATAFGLAVVLTSFYPNGRRLFYAFAAGVAMQRVCVGAHFLSDVLVGIALGVAWGSACSGAGLLAGRFDAVEVWWNHRFGWPLPEGHPSLAEASPEDGVLAMPTRNESVAAASRRAA